MFLTATGKQLSGSMVHSYVRLHVHRRSVCDETRRALHAHLLENNDTLILLFAEDELISKYCRGWICPRSQKCVVRIVGFCKGFNCTVERSCRMFTISSVQHNANTSDKVICFLNFNVCAERTQEIYRLIPRSENILLGKIFRST